MFDNKFYAYICSGDGAQVSYLTDKKHYPFNKTRLWTQKLRSLTERSAASKTTGRLDFKIQDNVMVIEHTRAFEKGKGVGRKLVVAAIEYAKDKGMKINPVCSFAYELMQKDVKYHELLVDEAGESLSCSL